VKEALGQVIAKKHAVAEIARVREEKEREIQVVEQEQNRIRQNMAQLDRTNELYAKYAVYSCDNGIAVLALARGPHGCFFMAR
jgi:hypothetical protein